MEQYDFIATYNDIEIELKAYINDLQFIYRDGVLIDVSFKLGCASPRYLKDTYNLTPKKAMILLKYFNDNLKVVDEVKKDLTK